MALKTLGPAHSLLVYKRGLARVRPYPYHAVLDEVGLILGATSKKGAPSVQTQKPEDQAQVAPTDFGENATNPVFGRTQTWRTFHLGMGLAVEDEDPTRAEGRYRWAINADASVASRLAMKGPHIRWITPPSVDPSGIRKFFDLGGKLYWLNGRYLTRIDDDSNASVVGDFGAGNEAIDVCVFWSNGLTKSWAYISVVKPPVATTEEGEGADQTMMIPGDLTEDGIAQGMWRFDGTTLEQHTTITALHLCAIGRNFYRANDRNQVSSVDVDTDPWVAANWRAENQFLIGDRRAPITALIENAVGVLLINKWDGIYSVPADPTTQESVRYFPFLKFGRSGDNGVTWGAFMNDIYTRYGEALYRITPEMSIEEVGPNRAGTVTGPVKGRTTAFAGHGNFHGYTGMWDPDTDTAFLMKYGAHANNERGEPERIEAWHGSICYPVEDDRITQLYVSPWGAQESHNRMYIGMRSGRVGYFQLPCVPDAAACAHYKWSLDPAWVVFPNWHAGFASDLKPLRYVAVTGDNLDAEEYATVSYRLEPVSADATTGMPWVELSGRFDTMPTERIEFPDGTQCMVAALRLELHNGSIDQTPLVSSLSLRWRLVTDFTQVYSMVILAEDGLICRDGTPLRRGAKAIRDHVRRIITVGAIVRLILPDEEVKLVSLIGYGEAIGWYERQERWASGIKVQFAEDSAGGTYGTYKRLLGKKYRDLVGMKYRDLLTL